MIRLSCSDYTFPLPALAQPFQLLKLLGFKYVDIGLFERSEGLRPGQFLAEPRQFTKQLRDELKRAELQASDIFLQIVVDPSNCATNDPEPICRAQNRKIFLATLDLCSALECIHMTGLPGVTHCGLEESEDLACAVEETRWRKDTALRTGITYSIEAQIGSICSDLAGKRTFLEAVDGLTLTLDYGHFLTAGFKSTDIHPLLHSASHIHARGCAEKRLQTPVSENEIDFAGMVHHLQRLKYDGFLALEYVWIDWEHYNRVDNVSETILLRRQLEEFLRLEETGAPSI